MTLNSKTRHGPGDLADSVGSAARVTLGAIRRMAVKVTSRALWQLAGHRLLDGSRETRDAEVFYGIGIWSRPKSSERVEAVVAFMGGGAGNPVIVATRNEDARKAVAAALNGGAGLAEDEAVVYSGAALVHIKANGTVEIRQPGGAAVALATLADVQALRTSYNSHTHTGVTTGSGTSATTTVVAAAPTGTSVLKGQ